MDPDASVTPAILDDPNNVHYLLPNAETTACGMDWAAEDYVTGVSEAVAARIGYCADCTQNVEEADDDAALLSTADLRARVADRVDGVEARPEDPGIIRKREWLAIHRALEDADPDS